MLVIKIEAEKTKENYRAVIDALAEFDIVSSAWEDGTTTPEVNIRSGATGKDLSSAVSAAVDKASRANK